MFDCLTSHPVSCVVFVSLLGRLKELVESVTKQQFGPHVTRFTLTAMVEDEEDPDGDDLEVPTIMVHVRH